MIFLSSKLIKNNNNIRFGDSFSFGVTQVRIQRITKYKYIENAEFHRMKRYM